MRFILCISVIFLLVTGGVCYALDFEIREVIEVGPIYQGSMLRPAQWSPNGQWIAYFDGKELRLADTMGVSHAVAEVEFVPMKFRWVGNEEVVVFQKLIVTNGESQRRLSKIDIVTGAQSPLEEYTHRTLSPDRYRYRRAGNLRQTVEGNAYYGISEEGQQWKEMVPFKNGVRSSPKDNHILRTHEGGVYLVRMDFLDSTKITRKPYQSELGAPLKINNEHSFIMVEGIIVRLSDEHVIVLDTLSIIRSLSGCAEGEELIWSYSMNPLFPEVCFLLICTDYDENETIRTGVFDYITYQFDVIDDMAGLTRCHRPEYSPNGKDLSVISQRQLYIIKRTIL